MYLFYLRAGIDLTRLDFIIQILVIPFVFARIVRLEARYLEALAKLA